jgi:osmoprotectant transport system ATP-binding protein
VPLLLGWNKKKARDRATELMETVGLTPEMARRYPGQLSGGQQQRVGVARALAADPPVLLMDEPFSAVDPVVRESLQDELLKLQAELGKTIVFVTHDIDEAVKLGDRVAVFRVGGKLAQYDEPGVLLARPADQFVDSFVGRDRGYRGLSFLSSKRLPLHELRTVRSGDRTDEGWTLVLDADGRPLGWHHDRTGGATADADDVVPGGSLYDTGSGSLRSALDAALSSPSGQGVAVDGDGRAVGAVAADDVLEALAAVRRAEAA